MLGECPVFLGRFTQVGYACPLYVRRGVVSEGSEVMMGRWDADGGHWYPADFSKIPSFDMHSRWLLSNVFFFFNWHLYLL